MKETIEGEIKFHKIWQSILSSLLPLILSIMFIIGLLTIVFYNSYKYGFKIKVVQQAIFPSWNYSLNSSSTIMAQNYANALMRELGLLFFIFILMSSIYFYLMRKKRK